MKIITLKATDTNPVKDISLCLGFFDGMHLAHQRLFEETKRQPHPTGIMTLSTQIPSFLHQEAYYALTTLADKIEIADLYGFDYFFVLEVTDEFVHMEPDAFIARYLDCCRKVIVGFDFRFGYKGSGNAEYLKTKLPDKAIIIPEMDYYGKKIGSTRLRKLLSEGKVRLVNRMLGRCYRIRGIVVPGRGRGKTLGFPTANIEYDGYFLPRPGVYYTTVDSMDGKYDAMTYIGSNPTFKDGKMVLETHIFGISGDFYNQPLSINFHAYIRPEIAFGDQTGLVNQIKKDEAYIKGLASTRRKS